MERENIASSSSTSTVTIQETHQEKKILVLKLREKCVKWDENVVNNEFMGKKSSKSEFLFSVPSFPLIELTC